MVDAFLDEMVQHVDFGFFFFDTEGLAMGGRVVNDASRVLILTMKGKKQVDAMRERKGRGAGEGERTFICWRDLR